ncbi:MAG: FemAB family PEP-CTERM system-associated protein [Thermoguttaceae bacterium]|nr:FemAB family PEP-CTERM system-associated protein [Thermoguttaceae bacterium]MDW8036998.1 FemAB family PEP-CTERM system-associated protein [Thermoguttaceae bacterium]
MSNRRVEFTVRLIEEPQVAARLPAWTAYVQSRDQRSPSRWPGWLRVLERSMGHRPYCLEAVGQSSAPALPSRMQGRLAVGSEQIVGLLPLAYVRSLLFGRFLVGLPYLNVGGVLADTDQAAQALVEEAAQLADRLDVRYMELRHESPLEHPRLSERLTSKVHMRLALPSTSDQLWKNFDPKVRNQVRKAERLELTVHWGSLDLLADFYRVFSHNMRDLGTPVFPRSLFRAILEEFPSAAELCVVRMGRKAVAGALLVHGQGMTEVPSASSLRKYNYTCANMLMYWHLLSRAIERGQHCFDFGRSTIDSPTYRFKKQWGAQPAEAVWQYYLRRGTIHEMRPESGRFRLAIRLWRRLPVWLTRLLGPWIVRGIP